MVGVVADALKTGLFVQVLGARVDFIDIQHEVSVLVLVRLQMGNDGL